MKTTVAVVGEYQIGKSTLVNCLLESCSAVTGRGLRTTAENQRHELTQFVDLIDTPGFNASETDDAIASSAIQDAFAFVFVMEAKMLGDKAKEIVKRMFQTGRRCIFVYNCNNTECWDPDNENNHITCQTIDAQIKSAGLSDLCMSVNGNLILMVNALWACYGLGLLQLQAASENIEEAKWAKAAVRKIEKFLKWEFVDLSPERYREEMLRRSKINDLREFLEELPLKALVSFAQDASKEIKRISDRFLADLQNRCNEFADGMMEIFAR